MARLDLRDRSAEKRRYYLSLSPAARAARRVSDMKRYHADPLKRGMTVRKPQIYLRRDLWAILDKIAADEFEDVGVIVSRILKRRLLK